MSVNYNPATPTNGLVLCIDPSNPRCYPGSGTTVFDLSGNNNNGTLTNGASVVNTRGGRALDFDGVNDFVSTPTITFGSSIVTLSGFFNLSPPTGGTRIIFESSTNYNTQNAFIVSQLSNGNINVFMSRTGALYPAAYCGATFPSIPTGQWIHLFAQLDRSLAPALTATRLWLNGVEQTGSQTFAGMGVMLGDFSNHPCFIAARSDGSLPISMRSDDLRLFSRALTESEIRQLFESKRGKYL